MRVVICGAGTAGCVAAARLSEDAATEVTLLEVGPHYRPGAWPAARAASANRSCSSIHPGRG